MPRLIDTESRTDTLIAAVNDILATEGAAALTLRRVAKVSRVSTSSILHHLDSRERLVQISAARTARARRARFLAAQDRYDQERGLLALLPGSGDEVVDARAWLGWLELWRADPGLAPIFDDHCQEMTWMLDQLTANRLSPTQLAATLALADGLTIALCAPTRPLAREAADDALTGRLRGLGVMGDPPGTGAGRVRSRTVAAMLASARHRDPGLFA